MSEVEFVYRPIEKWPGEPTRKPKPSPFGGYRKKSLPSKQIEAMLRRELKMLGVKRAIIQLYLSERDIRKDQLPRRDARPQKPGVIVSAEIPDVGWRSFYVDAFDHWHANLQAIAVGFEDSRRLERYGFAKNREQYRGFPALKSPDGNLPDRSESEVEWARRTIAEYADVKADSIGRDNLRVVIRWAQSAAHPDNDGTNEDFLRVQEAKEILEGRA